MHCTAPISLIRGMYMHCIETTPYRAYFLRDLNFANDRNFRFVDLFFTNCYSLSVVTPM